MPPSKHAINTNTIFLTPEEDARLRKTFKARFQKCQELAGQPRIPSSPNSLQSQIATASLMADMSLLGLQSQNGRKEDAIVAYSVGTPYPPCTRPLQDLKPMSMSELKMDTHHRGRVLNVKRVAPVIKLVLSSWTLVQGEDGEMERLEVMLHKESHGCDILESGEIFQVKEPYFTISDQGEATLRIDHPSDLVCMDSSTEGYGDSEDAVMKARQCKEEGNTALKTRDLLLAHAKYTRGLDILTTAGAAKDDITNDLYRNRAHINLLLSRFDEAKTDALSSLTHLPSPSPKQRELDSKAYLRAGLASYSSHDFPSTRKFWQEQLRLMPGDKEAKARVRKVELRIKEQETGCYDFKALKVSLLLSKSARVDVASFVSNITIGPSPGRGRGLFATRDLHTGDLIFAEKSFCAVFGEEEAALNAMTYDLRDEGVRVFPAGLCRAVVQKLLDNPSQVSKVMDLFGDYRAQKSEEAGDGGGGEGVVDVFQVHDIVARNAFGLGPAPSRLEGGGYRGEESSGKASVGLWIMASYMNHSCIPNAEKEYIGDLMILRATTEIREGEEVVHNYAQVDGDFKRRRKVLMDTWGFECSCLLCVKHRSPV
jgi:hypothetical protein